MRGADQKQSASPPLPITWQGFIQSSFPTDKKNVVAVLKTGTTKWWETCAAWGRETRGHDERREKAYLAYLTSERLINGPDRGHVSDRSIDIGMTECGVFAALGMPEHLNQTETAYGTTAQFVYRSGRLYVYTEPGRGNGPNVVRAIQH